MVVFSLLHVNIWNIHVLTPFLEPPYLHVSPRVMSHVISFVYFVEGRFGVV